MTTPAEEEFTELRDAQIPRVDLVDKAANGMTFLIAKRADGTGLLDTDLIRDLIAKSEPDAEPAAAGEQVTMTGSPAAIAKLIHGAPMRNPGETATAGVVKDADIDETPDAMDPAVLLAEPDEGAPGDPAAPGSPAWESTDAATARKWTSILARAKHAIAMLAEREMIEAATVDPGDGMNAMDLDDACCAIDYAISVLAPFAVAEQAEADCATDEMTAVGKALATWNTEPLDTIEALSHVAKAGRVLSTGNEAAIRNAVEQLQKVLASLPAAPTAPDESGQAVAKQEDAVADTATPQTEPAAEPITKADSAPQVPIYDRKGNLVGIVDPASIVPVVIDEDDEPEAPIEEPMAEPGDVTPDAPEVTDLTPEPSAEVGIPADTVPDNEDDLAKTTDPTVPTTDTPSDAESSTTDVTKSPDTDSATQEQAIAKQAETIAQLAETVETLKGQIRALEEQPAEPKVFTNGAIPPGTQAQLRGQDRGAQPSVDVAKAQEMKKGLYGAADAGEQNTIARDMQQMAIARLQEIHHGGARQ